MRQQGSHLRHSAAPPVASSASLDGPLQRDPKWRAYRDECEVALASFERAKEWADLVGDLQRLQRVLNKYAQLPSVPDTVLVGKRLCQCLNPALPPGVHLKTLETYELIFERIGSRRLARDLGYYSEGIFPLYRQASYQVSKYRRLLDVSTLIITLIITLIPLA